MQIAIVDDEPSQQELLMKYLGEWNKTPMTFRIFSSSEAFLFAWEDKKDYDLLILDIEMGKMNGIELAKHLREENDPVPIVFVTGYAEYMQYGYDVSALHYLMKPADKTRLFDVMDKVLAHKHEDLKVFVETTSGVAGIDSSRILYIEADGHQCILHLRNESIVIKDSMTSFESKLEGRREFVRCHRSYIVNLAYVSMLLKTDVVMDNNERVPLARNAAKNVNEQFIACYRRTQ